MRHPGTGTVTLFGFIPWLIACGSGSPPTSARPNDAIETWQTLGPSQTYAIQVRFHPTQPTVYVGMDDGGGVWRSRDGGTSFAHVSTQVRDVNGWTLEIDPKSADHVLAGDSGGRGAYETLDGGDTWAFVNQGLDTFEARTVVDAAFDAARDRTYLATDGGVFRRSASSGWEAAPGWSTVGVPSASQVAVVKTGDSTRLFAASFKPKSSGSNEGTSSLFVSDDEGATFQPLQAALTSAGVKLDAFLVRDMPVDAQGRLYVVGPGFVLRSSNAGASFEVLPVSPVSSFPRVAFDPKNAQTIHISGNYDLTPALWSSVDDGKTFKAGATGLPGAFPLGLGVDPRSGRVYLGTYSDLFVSDDNGKTFGANNFGMINSCPNAIAAVPEDEHSRLYVGLLGRNNLYSSRNAFTWAGGEFTELSMPWDAVEIATFASDAQTVLLGTVAIGSGGHGLWRSIDGGKATAPVPSVPGDGSIFALSTSEAVALASVYSGANSGIYRSTDRGASFARVSEKVPSDFYVHSLSVFAVTANDVLKSEDAGTTWQVLAQGAFGDSNPRSIVVLNADATSWLIGTEKGRIYRTDDGGKTLQELESPFVGKAGVNELLVDAHDGAIYAGLFSANVFYRSLERPSGVFRSIDGGQTWSSVGASTRALGTHIVRMTWDPNDDRVLYAAAWCGGVGRMQIRK